MSDRGRDMTESEKARVIELLKTGRVVEFSHWREEHLDVRLNLAGIDLEGAILFDHGLNQRCIEYLTGVSDEEHTPALNDFYHAHGWRCRINLNGADLSGANLSGACLCYARLRGANLSGARLDHARMLEADLTEADLTGADLSDTRMVKAKLRSAQLAGAALNGAFLFEASLYRASLKGADLSDADLCGACMRGTSLLEAASLSGACFLCTVFDRDVHEQISGSLDSRGYYQP